MKIFCYLGAYRVRGSSCARHVVMALNGVHKTRACPGMMQEGACKIHRPGVPSFLECPELERLLVRWIAFTMPIPCGSWL
jgi:hypothetical protein